MSLWETRTVIAYSSKELLPGCYVPRYVLDCGHSHTILGPMPAIGSSRACRSCGVAGASSSGGTTVDPVTGGGG